MDTIVSSEIVCPACGSSWHESRYRDLSVGSYVSCPQCGAVLTIFERVVSLKARLSTRNEALEAIRDMLDSGEVVVTDIKHTYEPEDVIIQEEVSIQFENLNRLLPYESTDIDRAQLQTLQERLDQKAK